MPEWCFKGDWGGGGIIVKHSLSRYKVLFGIIRTSSCTKIKIRVDMRILNELLCVREPFTSMITSIATFASIFCLNSFIWRY